MIIDWGRAPEGWKLVPIVPTAEMRSAAGSEESAYNKRRATFYAGDSWLPMVEAAPQFTPSAWTGEGQPPVGSEVEMRHSSWGPDRWERRVVKYLGTEKAVTSEPGADDENVSYVKCLSFRPIRTAEQIAAEERQKEIDGMICEMQRSRTGFGTSQLEAKDIATGYAEALHKAGYRKQVTP